MNYKNTLITSALLIAAMAIQNPVGAQAGVKNWEKNVQVGNSSLYYKLGGSQALSRPPGSLTINAKLGLTGSIGLSYSCGRFKFSLDGIKASLQAKVEEYKQLITIAVNNAIAALPMYILARSAPDLYNIVQQLTVEAQAELAAAFKTCEEMEREIADGKDPYEDYARMAKLENWKVETSASSDTNVYSAKIKIRLEGGKKGTEWIGGTKKGGVNQEPIRVVQDVVRAGYMSTNGQQPRGANFFNGGGSTAGNSSFAMTQHFPTASAAEKFATDVLGEIEVGTCEVSEGCPEKGAKPGLGLLPQVQNETTLATAQLLDFLSGNTNAGQYNVTKLQQASAPGLAITRDVVEALKGMEPADRQVFANRLAQEIAQVRIMERALMLRNIMMTGLQTPEVRGNAAAANDIREKLKDLQQYIEDTLFEIRARKEVMSSTAELLVNYHRARQGASSAVPTRGVQDPAPLVNGKVPK